VIGLKPWEYARMTQDEVQLLVEGCQYKQEIELNSTRILGSWILAAAGSKKSKPEQILPLKIYDGIANEAKFAPLIAKMKGGK
jgi:hypothetical protein